MRLFLTFQFFHGKNPANRSMRRTAVPVKINLIATISIIASTSKPNMEIISHI